MLRRIVSGGQTGVDRAALDAAIAAGVEHGGFCPRGRRAEDGPLPARYQLEELDDPGYPARTEANVIYSDATLIVAERPLTGGTALTARLAQRHGKPLRIESPAADLEALAAWLDSIGVGILNVAGPRESTSPGIYRKAFAVVMALLERFAKK